MNAASGRIAIGHVDVGDDLPCFLIAEIGLNHNGSVDLAHRLVEAAALAGASMVKFQKRSPEDLAVASFLDAPFPKAPLFGRTQREVRTRLELSAEQLAELRDHAADLGLLFSTSAFDLPSLEVALSLDVPVLKLASHSMTNGPLLAAAAAAGVPVIASMGATTWPERDAAMRLLGETPLCLLHCVSAYPCPDALVRLDTMAELRHRYDRPVGYSGHEDGIDVSVAAAVLGACVIERHLTLDRSMVGLDHAASLEPAEFAALASRIRRLQKVRGVTDGIAPEEQGSRLNYHVAIRAGRALAAGHVLAAGDLVCKQPLADAAAFFTGLELDAVVGRRLTVDLAPDEALPRTALAAPLVAVA